jgi:hypothetical protein
VADYRAPDPLLTFKRGDKNELWLVKEEYNGRTSFVFREMWRGDDGNMRWSQSQPDKNGKHWASVKLREDEFQALAKFILGKAKGKSEPPPEPPPKPVNTDDVPF